MTDHHLAQPEHSRICDMGEYDSNAQGDWLTEEMAYELAVACQMAGIPCRTRGPAELSESGVAPLNADEVTINKEEEPVAPKKMSRQETKEAFDQLILGANADAVGTICREMTLSRAMVEDFVLCLQPLGGSDSGVQSVAMLVGPHGSGKTSLARLYAQTIGRGDQVIEIDLAGMTSQYSGAMIDGVEPGFRDSGPGYLTSRVKAAPFAVIIFDNPERASADVLMRIAQMIRTGRMADRFAEAVPAQPATGNRQDAAVDFQHTTVIFTTSAGSEVYDSPDCLQKAQGDRRVLGAMLLKSLEQASRDGQDDGSGMPASLLRLLSSRVHLMPRPSMQELETALARALKKAMDDYLDRFFDPLAVTFRLGEDAATLIRALLLTVARGATMRDARQSLPNVFMQAVCRGMAGADRVPGLIQVDVDASVCTEIARLSGLVTGGRSLIEELARRQLQLDPVFDSQRRRDGDELIIRLARVDVRQIVAPDDLGGMHGIEVQIPAVQFEDVIGQDGAKRQLGALARLLALSGSDAKVCAAMPRGLVLHGEPGTGKTMLAKALAHQGDAPFISTVGSDWRDPQRVRSIMSTARRYAPSVVFIDEIDAIGRRDDRTGSREAINVMLAEIDGFASSMHLPVLIVGATNDLNGIDPALLRAGRLDIHVRMQPLRPDHRATMLARAFKTAGIEEAVPQALINMTAGCKGADLSRIHREVVCASALHGESRISMPLLKHTVLRVIEGEEGSQASEGAIEQASYHEAGHAVAARLLLPDQPISHVSIIRRQEHDGLVKMVGEGPGARHLTVTRVKATLQVLVAGRMAERLAFGEASVSSGCAADLEAASRLAFEAIGAWGMDESYGLWSAPADPPQWRLVTGAEVIARARQWMAEASDMVEQLLTQNWVHVEALAQQLKLQGWVEGTQVLVSRGYDR